VRLYGYRPKSVTAGLGCSLMYAGSICDDRAAEAGLYRQSGSYINEPYIYLLSNKKETDRVTMWRLRAGHAVVGRAEERDDGCGETRCELQQQQPRRR